MATAAQPTVLPATRGRHSRRKPFASWVKRLTGYKHSPSGASPSENQPPQPANPNAKPRKRGPNRNNNPYPESGFSLPAPRSPPAVGGRQSTTTPASLGGTSVISYEDNVSGHGGHVRSTRSAAPTVATNAETVNSDAGQSKAGTNMTAGGALSSHGGGNSTFSSPRHSSESLTTTLTTIQSTAPSNLMPHMPHHATPSPVHFTHQYPTSPAGAPLPAGPHHLAPNHPHTYSAAIANNILTDNASVLTLASSSKRRRRHSLDTDASVRALAPSSLFGNSRESLPLSVLSGNVDAASIAGGIQPRVSALASAERASVYSSSGVVPVGASAAGERGSGAFSANRTVDGASVRSAGIGHGKTDSVSGSISGIAGSPLASPRDPPGTAQGRPSIASRRNSDGREGDEPEKNE